jgi:hypothetical protein
VLFLANAISVPKEHKTAYNFWKLEMESKNEKA